ncbi:hypothetical protein [Cyanobium sp. Lug-B]|uniref:hypothetical protein n=1 Tax=Cyanobium sp. Lug-B TaxID=2823716 RepID=UPI0020CC93D8|nr:hypothetical protein [Cyanobium sp. Lug-B]
MQPRSEFDPQSGQMNQVTPISPKPVLEVWPEWMAMGRELNAGSRFAEALALGVGAEHLWLRPPLWDVRIDLSEPDGAGLKLMIAEYQEYAIDDPTPHHSMNSTKTGRQLVTMEYWPIARTQNNTVLIGRKPD